MSHTVCGGAPWNGPSYSLRPELQAEVDSADILITVYGGNGESNVKVKQPTYRYSGTEKVRGGEMMMVAEKVSSGKKWSVKR